MPSNMNRRVHSRRSRPPPPRSRSSAPPHVLGGPVLSLPARRSRWPTSVSARNRSGRSAAAGPSGDPDRGRLRYGEGRHALRGVGQGPASRHRPKAAGESRLERRLNHLRAAATWAKRSSRPIMPSSAADKFKGCATYVDFRELLEKEKDLDAVKIMTPDHTHAGIAIAAMKKGKHVIVHKPLANRGAGSHGWSSRRPAKRKSARTSCRPATGARSPGPARWSRTAPSARCGSCTIGRPGRCGPTIRRVPTDTPPIPKDFDWTLWLGPSLDRPYHPNYTHTNFRGWYEFGGGSIADMGHYSLWPVFQALGSGRADQRRIDAQSSLHGRPMGSAVRIENDYSFPVACTIRMPVRGQGRPAGAGPLLV